VQKELTQQVRGVHRQCVVFHEEIRLEEEVDVWLLQTDCPERRSRLFEQFIANFWFL